LPIPERPWDAISMDFVLGLPRMKKGFDSIFVVMDRFSKMAYPEELSQTENTKFVGHFWRTLWKKLGIDLSFISSYHPHTNGQTEVVNRSLRLMQEHCLYIKRASAETIGQLDKPTHILITP
jgi:hypothetical protein